MFVTEKPPLDDELLIHYGIPGMRWGHRKPEEVSSGVRRVAGAAPVVKQRRKLSEGQKKAIRGAVAVGAVAGLFILSQRGMTPRGKALQAKTLPIGLNANRRVLGLYGKTAVRSVPKVITTTAKTAKVTGKVGVKTAKVGGRLGAWTGKTIARSTYNAATARGEQIAASYRAYKAARLAPKPVKLGKRISQSLVDRFGSMRFRPNS